MDSIYKTLIEQMKISDIEINTRKHILNISQDDINILIYHNTIITQNIEQILDNFEKELLSISEIALVIGDTDSLYNLKKAIKQYIIEMFLGFYDEQYVNNRLRVGMVHKRIGVEPKLYLAGIKTLKNIIIEVLKNNSKDKDTLRKVVHALDKLFYFDITLVFDAYIQSLLNEIKNEKNKTEIYAKSLENKVHERTKKLEELSRIDSLTNIYNRRTMIEFLRRETLLIKRNKTELSFAYIDLDKFKEINDTQGHLKGDEVLKNMGHILTTSIRETDIACRYGGDEFCLILPNCNAKNSEKICKKIVLEYEKKYPKYTLSIGIVIVNSESNFTSEDIIKQADDKMYLSKEKDISSISF